jgi:hypothetical protein
MERSNTHPEEDFKTLSLDTEEEYENTFNHPFVVKCREIKEHIESLDIEDVREYLNSDIMKMSIIRLHDYYQQNISNIPNTSIIKKEIDGLLWYLDIPPERLIVKLK